MVVSDTVCDCFNGSDYALLLLQEGKPNDTDVNDPKIFLKKGEQLYGLH